MIFSIVVMLMVLLVTMFWVYQGFFSGVIMLVETVVACLAAFGFYEALHALWADSLGPGLGLPLALMLIFGVVLALLRTLTDKLVPGNVNIPMYVDRAGGGVCGFFSGMILVGTALVAVQMLPIGSSVFGFERVRVDREGLPVTKNLYFKPDAFTVGMVNMMSNGRFGTGDNAFGRAKPDLLLDLYAYRAATQTEERHFIPKDALQVTAYWEARQIDTVKHTLSGGSLERTYTTAEPTGFNKLLVCRVIVKPSAAPEGASDVRFRVPQFRIVGPPPKPGRAGGPDPIVHLAVGLSDLYINKNYDTAALRKQQTARLVRFNPDTNFIVGPTPTASIGVKETSGGTEIITGYEFDVAFEVPADFEPWYVEFKRGARVELNDDMRLTEPPDDASTALGASGVRADAGSGAPSGGRRADAGEPTATPNAGATVGEAPRGRVHVASAINARTGVSTELPIALDSRDAQTARCLQGGLFAEGHIAVPTPADVPADARVTEFAVPAGKRLVQVGAEVQDPQSIFGQALNFAARVRQQIYVRTDDGRDYFAIGTYAEAPAEGRRIFELQLWPNAEVPERALREPRTLKASVLRAVPEDERKYGFLFLVDPGVKIVSFHAGARRGSQPLNIDVPP